MKEEIKEKLLKEWKKEIEDCPKIHSHSEDDEEGYESCLCCNAIERINIKYEAKLQQHEETSKAKDEEFNKILDDELEKIEYYTFKNLDTLYEDLDSCDEDLDSCEEEYEKTIHTHQLEGRRFCIEEIKQRIKEK